MSTPLTIVTANDCDIGLQFGNEIKIYGDSISLNIINKGYKDLKKLNELQNEIYLFIVSPYASGKKSRVIRRFQRKLNKFDDNELNIRYSILSLSNAINESNTMNKSLIKLKSNNFYPLTICQATNDQYVILYINLSKKNMRLCINMEISREILPENWIKKFLNEYQNLKNIEEKETEQKRTVRLSRHLDLNIPNITIGYGTATGNAKHISFEIAEVATNSNDKIRVQGPMELNTLATKNQFMLLPERKVLLIVCSTTGIYRLETLLICPYIILYCVILWYTIYVYYIIIIIIGDGEIPETGSRFYRKLKLKSSKAFKYKETQKRKKCKDFYESSDSEHKDVLCTINESKIDDIPYNEDTSYWLKGTYYAILGLGDSNYSQFNAAARKIDNLLQSLGAYRFYPTGYADDGTG